MLGCGILGDGGCAGIAQYGKDRKRGLVHGVKMQTRRVLALALSAALNAPIGDTRFGVFRM